MKAELAKGDVCAVIIEGIQGVGGIQMPTTEFMQAIRTECDKYGTVFIVDESSRATGGAENSSPTSTTAYART